MRFAQHGAPLLSTSDLQEITLAFLGERHERLLGLGACQSLEELRGFAVHLRDQPFCVTQLPPSHRVDHACDTTAPAGFNTWRQCIYVYALAMRHRVRL